MQDKKMDFQIHCFGYGEDHDEKILSEISFERGGNFYFIKNQEYIKECFLSCLSYLITIMAYKAEIKIFLG